MRSITEQRAAKTSISQQPSVARVLIAVGVEPAKPECAAGQGKKRGQCQSCSRNFGRKVENRCSKSRNVNSLFAASMDIKRYVMLATSAPCEWTRMKFSVDWLYS
jgi:hypothetical protein